MDQDEFIGCCMRLMPLMMRAMLRREDNELASGRISLPQFNVLDYLHMTGEATMHEIAENLSLAPSNLTGIMDRLVLLKVVKRGNDDRDRRVVKACITSAGIAMLERIKEEKRATLGQLFHCITPRERAVYLSVMEKFIQELV